LLPLLLPFNAAFQRCFCCYCCCCCCCCSSIDTGVAAVVVQSTPHSRAFPLLLTAAPSLLPHDLRPYPHPSATSSLMGQAPPVEALLPSGLHGLCPPVQSTWPPLRPSCNQLDETRANIRRRDALTCTPLDAASCGAGVGART
jgi:hypothetical protein